jgi:hypothetical protein
MRKIKTKKVDKIGKISRRRIQKKRIYPKIELLSSDYICKHYFQFSKSPFINHMYKE